MDREVLTRKYVNKDVKKALNTPGVYLGEKRLGRKATEEKEEIIAKNNS